MKSTLFNMVNGAVRDHTARFRRRGSGPYDYRGADCEARVKATREALKQVLPEFDETRIRH